MNRANRQCRRSRGESRNQITGRNRSAYQAINGPPGRRVSGIAFSTAVRIFLGCGLGLLLSWPLKASPLIGIGLNFTGSTYEKNDFSVPPDSNGAVGPNHFVELINGRFAVYSKTNGGLLKSITGLNFWIQDGIPIRASSMTRRFSAGSRHKLTSIRTA